MPCVQFLISSSMTASFSRTPGKKRVDGDKTVGDGIGARGME
jgi:hypothetical protein